MESAPLQITPEQMFASVKGMRPDDDPFPNLLPGRERRVRAFLVRFGEESPKELNEILSDPAKYQPLGPPKEEFCEDGLRIRVIYMEGGLASAEEIQKWREGRRKQEEDRIAAWRKAQKKLKNRPGIPDYDGLLTEKEKGGVSDEARQKATDYDDDDLESPIDGSIPAAGSTP